MKYELKAGDRVVMHTCLEANRPKNFAKVWKVTTDQYKMCNQDVVMLEGYSGAFSAEFLQKVDDPQFDFAKILGNKINDGEMDCFIGARCPKHGDCVKCLLEWAEERKKVTECEK